MGANHSLGKNRQNFCNAVNTPPKTNHRLLFDPRSPSDCISRTPIQIDNQVLPPSKLYNHVMPHITGPDMNIPENSDENANCKSALNVEEDEPKRISNVEPTLDPTVTLTALVTNNNGQLPPYQL
ncbi:unnamed protein product [Adineta ricciae]|uniref:Uncharacterized protein n=1 Tax=Adineta ricciae TaxID=249248 RepID=A0A814A803_ADIRI|nr:unnamed protein product [Adineta ricciae]